MLDRPGTSDPEVLWDAFWGNHHPSSVPLPASCVILDMGANAEYTVDYFTASFLRATIHVVKMDMGNMVLARKTMEFSKGRCRSLQVAEWSKSGTIYYCDADEWGFQVISNCVGE